MKQKLLQVRKLPMRWRLLAVVFLVLGVVVPTALAASNEWWGTADGDFSGTPQNNNYIIHPPADQLPRSGEDGPRLQFILHKFQNGSKTGTTAAYLPHQYLLSSSVPKVSFEVRGGYWRQSNCQGDNGTGGICDAENTSARYRDRYDRRDANPSWVVDYMKEQGYLSPFYYEVYQLSNGNPGDGDLLGVINPRDTGIFPTSDNGPQNNTDCHYVGTTAKGPCWRKFEINAPGGSASAITNRITLDGNPQDSCAKRIVNHNNQCYSGNAISLGETTPNGKVLAKNGRLYGPELWQPSPAMADIIGDTLAFQWANDNEGRRKDRPSFLRKLLFDEALAVVSTHPVTVHVSPNQKAAGHVDVSVQSGNGGQCRDRNGNFVNKATKSFDGSDVTFSCKDGYNYTVSVAPADFNYYLSDLNQGGCHIGDTAQNIGGGGSASFTYNCRHRIRAFVNPTARTGGHVKVELTGGQCSGGNTQWIEDHPGSPNDGSTLFTGCQDDQNYTVHARTNSFFDDQGNYYCELGNYPSSQNFGANEFSPSGLKYHCYPAVQNDGNAVRGVAMNSANFANVSPTKRFEGDSQPNLKGNYVFLVKQVAYSDIGHGYVTNYDRLLFEDQNNYNGTGIDYKRGCPLPTGGNYVQCPNGLLSKAASKGNDQIVQNGYFLRTPKYADGPSTRQYIASAPAKWAFNFNYGPVIEGQQNEYSRFGQGNYTGLRFQAGGSACRDLNKLRIPNADWDNSSQYQTGGAFDYGIGAAVDRIGVADDYGTLVSTSNQSIGTNGVNISGDWTSNTSTGLFYGQIQVNDPPYLNPNSDYWSPPWSPTYGQGYPPTVAEPVYNPSWQTNEQLVGRLQINDRWDDGNNLVVGGMPFTWGYWPTCLNQGFDVTPDSPKSIFSGYKYNGKDTFTPMNNNGDAVIDFAFRYTLPETRGKVDYRVEINGGNRGGGTAFSGQGANAHGAGTTPGTHAVRVPVNVNDLQANTNYTWRACVNPGPLEKCTTSTTFQVNKGPTAQIVSGDPDYNTNTGNVNYNCSKLAMRLTDPEGNQVRPYFAVSWTSGGQTNVVTSFNRGGSNSDAWGRWTSGNGYRASGSTFTSDDVRVGAWTVNGSSRSVPNKTLTQFLQQDVPEGADVSWTASGEDRYGASDILGWPDLAFVTNSTPRAVNDSSYPSPGFGQLAMNYRRFGAPTPDTTFHKNTRPNLLPPGSTKKFFDLNGAVTEDITDGQLVRVETKLKNTGETPTKKYEIYDYLGSVRDFEPLITTSSDLPITVQYNDGAERAVSPLISRVIPNRSNGNLDQVENVISSDDDRRASYKLDFGTNPDQAVNVSITKNGKDYSSCSYGSGANAYCLTNYATYPNSVYFYCGGTGQLPGACGGTNNAAAVWSYRLDGAPTGTYDLTLSYYNRPNPDYPPPGYGSFHVKVDYPGGSRTVNLPIESNSQASSLHTFTLPGLDITGANPTVTLTWDNDAWDGGDANFGLDSLRLATAEDDTSDSILRRGQLNPGETVALRYYVRANRNRTTTDDSDPNNNFQRRLKVGSATGAIVPKPDPKGGTVDIGDAHVFVPYSEDYCNRSNPLLNHTCEFEPGDVLAPWLRGERGSIASNEGIFGYDPLPGESNATFLVQANGVLSHFSGGAGNLGGYQAAPATCAPAGDLDWRKEMYKNIQKLVAGDTHNMGSTVPAVMNLESGGNVWYRDGDLTIPARPDPARFRGVGTIVVKGNLTIEGDMAYDTNNTAINSLGIIVLGNINVKDSVTKMIGTYYVSDIDRDLAGQSNGCPVVDAANGVFTTGSSKTRLDVRGALVARQFNFERYFVDPSDSVADPAENVYYDGRVVANTPPGFSVFRDTSSWYEIAP